MRTLKCQEVLDARQESNNPYNRYVIASWKRASASDPNEVVSQLPNEVSRFTLFIQPMEQFSLYKSYLLNIAPLIRAGMEIPIEVCVAMATFNKNKQALVKYTELVTDHYEQPVGENF